ncbi:MAG: Tex family protein [Bacteroidota bacterium]|nr:Tex family protein [Bacteroidota bacterium]
MINKLQFVAQQSAIPEKIVTKTIELLDAACTIPFIARYRKEQTQNLDEVGVQLIDKLSKLYDELLSRKTFILETIEAQGKLNPELKQKINDCWDKTILEDLYLPYKQRKKTKADIAIEQGLEPLAKIILAQKEAGIERIAAKFLNQEVKDIEAAIQGAKYIVAQWINDDVETRKKLREQFEKYAIISTKIVKKKGATETDLTQSKYKDYVAFSELAHKAPSHRIMAILRAEDEGVLKVNVEPDFDRTIDMLNRTWVKKYTLLDYLMQEVVQDAYKRLLLPSLENEYLKTLFAKAEESAIAVFAENLKQLLLSSPLGNQSVLAIDPGIRTGCKTVCLDASGKVLSHTVLYFNSPKEQDESIAKIKNLLQQYSLQAIAVGNGTAGRDTAALIKKALPDFPLFLINEDGASIYSASEIARKEFPELDLTVRSAVSIGRRLMDPLSELVKIDPKNLGIGQYQHDVNEEKLRQTLDNTIVWCVNKVGVNLNLAGEELLKHVSGLGPVLAKNIIEYRKQNGNFKSKLELKKVARLGDKAFEQCAGFLRIKESENSLDKSGIHPEQYAQVKKMAQKVGVNVSELFMNETLVQDIKSDEKLKQEIGEYTFNDIIQELLKPGLDPREALVEEQFDERIKVIQDLKIGMILNGVVTNITNFGAFVDLGIKHKGLLHISEISDSFIQSPSEVLKLNQKLKVKIKEVDIPRERIALTLKY